MDDAPIGSCDIFAIIQMGVTVSKEHCSEHERARASRTLLVKFVFRIVKCGRKPISLSGIWSGFPECAMEGSGSCVRSRNRGSEMVRFKKAEKY